MSQARERRDPQVGESYSGDVYRTAKLNNIITLKRSTTLNKWLLGVSVWGMFGSIGYGFGYIFLLS
jgi:hypothetical protein